jgi:hypothetical protein
LAIPAFGALIAEPLYVLTDTAIVGHLGTPQLAGLAVASSVLLTLYAVFIFLAYGTTVAVSRLLGAADVREAAHQAVQSMWLALFIEGTNRKGYQRPDLVPDTVMVEGLVNGQPIDAAPRVVRPDGRTGWLYRLPVALKPAGTDDYPPLDLHLHPPHRRWLWWALRAVAARRRLQAPRKAQANRDPHEARSLSATDTLQGLLSSDWQPATEILGRMEAAGFSVDETRGARKRLGVTQVLGAVRFVDGHSRWRLPPDGCVACGRPWGAGGGWGDYWDRARPSPPITTSDRRIAGRPTRPSPSPVSTARARRSTTSTVTLAVERHGQR